jgi:Na+-transporting methylmalonyl-CoA/oxaloacetate decarboxylase beta subunit
MELHQIILMEVTLCSLLLLLLVVAEQVIGLLIAVNLVDQAEVVDRVQGKDLVQAEVEHLVKDILEELV